jgi:hypothetical protein
MKHQEKDFTSHVAYTRALEAYCENLEKFIAGKNGYKERINQLYEENLRLGNEQIDLADKTREECAQVCESTKSNWNYCAAAIRVMKERP